MKSLSTKIVASLAVVGTVAAIAALYSQGSSTIDNSASRFLAADQENLPDVAVQRAFQDFNMKYNKNYVTKEEYKARLQVFARNFDFVTKQNEANEGFQVGLNQFADLTEVEYQQMLGLRDIYDFDNENEDDEVNEAEEQQIEEDIGDRNLASYPSSLDWRQKGAISYVKHQSRCGGCYAFSTVSAIESLVQIQTG